MTKVEFLTVLESELKKRRIGEREEILAEYEQHFAFQRADGFSQEEICARLGDPAQLAAQFDAEGRAPAGGGKTAARAGIYALSVLALALYLVLAACGVAMLALCAASAALAVCLLGGLSAGALTPPMPYGCAAVFGVALAALSVLVAVGCVYFAGAAVAVAARIRTVFAAMPSPLREASPCCLQTRQRLVLHPGRGAPHADGGAGCVRYICGF